MQDKDFEKLGFKCGLEIHQQLQTDRKLFCRCPPVYRNDPPHYTILRHMRPTLSEMGTYDGTALMEFKTKKNITYEFYGDTNCTYEIDDTPPFEMDEKALEISLIIARSMSCHLVDEVHVSRKQYLDGTIPTGFQRTAIISLKGRVPWKKGKDINIRQISIEEDACREIKDEGHEITFRTDRLSIPLVEVVTEPDAKNPTEAGEMAKRLGWLMRSTSLVRRGSGATRQDVNVSVEGGQRVEIKGVPSLKMIPTITAGEAIRQHNLLKIKAELRKRGLSQDEMDVEEFGTMVRRDVTSIFAGRKVDLFSNWFEGKVKKRSGHKVYAVLIPGFKGLISHTTHYDQRFLDELSGRVRVIACVDRLPNLFSSDDEPARGITEEDIEAVGKDLGAKKDDAFVLVWGPKEDMETACQEIYLRAREAFLGVPNETRQRISDHTTSFERILPGPDRMYPDTDRPPIVITSELMERVDAQLPQPWWEVWEEMRKASIPDHVISKLVVSQELPIYKQAVAGGADPRLVAFTLVETYRHLSRKGIDMKGIPGQNVVFLFKEVSRGVIFKDAVSRVLELMGRESLGPVRAIEKLHIRPITQKRAEKTIQGIARKNADLVEMFKAGREGPLMGAVMNTLNGYFSGKEAYDIVKSL